MSDYTEVELKYGLNFVVYKITNDEVKRDTQLFLKNKGDNEYTHIGTLDEVRENTPAGSYTEVMNKKGKRIAKMDSTGALDTTLYAKNPNTPTNKGGKRKTKKYFRKRKTDKRKSKRKKKGKGKGKTRKFR